MANNAPFVIQPVLTGITVAYTNSKLIADQVLPRVPVARSVFKYTKYSLADGFTLPDTKVGRTSRPNEVSFGGTEAQNSTSDYGLEDPIPQEDIDNAAGTGVDIEGRSTEWLTDLIALGREKRAADLVFNAANYATANKQTLTGTAQWSDSSSDPIGDILGALDGMVMRGNILVVGRAVFSKLSTHPAIVKAFLGNAGDSGIVPASAIASMFGLDAVFVGQGWVNTAAKGQAPSLARVWGKHAALIYRDQFASADRGVSFGFTAQFGQRVALTRPDADIGLRGGTRIRVGEAVAEVLTANDLGYFFQNAVA